MGTRKTNQSTEATINCQTCSNTYSPACDYQQGRCPHHPPLINLEKFMNNEVEYRHPDPIKHKYISFAKSGVRIAAGAALCFGMFWSAGVLLILAEILGIVEEIV